MPSTTDTTTADLLSAVEPFLTPPLVSPESLQRVDWFVYFTAGATDFRRRVASLLASAIIRDAPPDSDWARTANLFRAWSEGDDAWRAKIPRIWMEFDSPDEAASEPQPSVLIELAPAADPGALLDGLLPLLPGVAPRPWRETPVLRCLTAVPSGGRVFCFGACSPAERRTSASVSAFQPCPP